MMRCLLAPCPGCRRVVMADEPEWMKHPACDGRIAELEADVTRLREALEAVHLVSQAEPTAHLLSIEAIARHALREGEPHE